MPIIKKLDPTLIDQIAAGEVVERPASVLKELLENAIDAGATDIVVNIERGGIKLLQVQDDGSGMSEEDLLICTNSHTTSKISDIEDLQRISTFGFRGEALASISAVSKLSIVTRPENSDVAYSLDVDGGKQDKSSRTSRDVGTTVSVSDLFSNVPARKKFLKTPQTEYRKVLETFIPVAMINPHIRLILNSDKKPVYNLPAIGEAEPGTLHPQRISAVLKSIELINLFFEGEGMSVGGFVAHPQHRSSRISQKYIFVNGRPIWDNGVAKAVSIGTNRFIPEGQRVPFIVAIQLPEEHVDVNVHPQKIEVRFSNPYRVYSAVEQAVKAAYEKDLGKVLDDIGYSRLRTNGVVSNVRKERSAVEGSGGEVDSAVSASSAAPKRYDVQKSLKFSKMILEDSGGARVGVIEALDSQSDHSIEEILNARQFLSRYIVASTLKSLLIIDQHAAAERIRFEALLREYEKKAIDSQKILVPVSVELPKSDIEFAKQTVKIMNNLGFAFEIDKDTIEISAVPAHLADADHAALFTDTIEKLKELEDFSGKDGKLKGDSRDDLIATMACHSSVRMNQRISDREAMQLIADLFRCDNSYSCPHGRPIIWELGMSEIDGHFDR